MFGWGKKDKDPDRSATRLGKAVAEQMPGADEATVRIVAAIAGLLGQVAYADHDYSAPEERAIREGLSRVEGLDRAAVDAVCATLRQHIGEIASIDGPRHARALRELADRDLRLHVLELLVDLAAADDELVVAETNVLRQTTTALGLAQDDYLAAQARHRDKLKVLR